MVNEKLKIIDYTVVAKIELNEFNRLVRGLLDSGWEPYGPMIKESGCTYYQAMVRVGLR